MLGSRALVRGPTPHPFGSFPQIFESRCAPARNPHPFVDKFAMTTTQVELGSIAVLFDLVARKIINSCTFLVRA